MAAVADDKRAKGTADDWSIDPAPPGLIDRPLDFLLAEHHRQRQAAALVDRTADGDFDRRGLAALIDFLEGDFARHIGDEEIVLFPVLRQHCPPEDDVGRILDRLQDEHRADEQIAEQAIFLLAARLAGAPLTREGQAALRRFADHVRSHLELENAVLLPLARARLRPTTLAMLADMLRARRGARRA
jgi:hemerythrin-like domain-containing protein